MSQPVFQACHQPGLPRGSRQWALWRSSSGALPAPARERAAPRGPRHLWPGPRPGAPPPTEPPTSFLCREKLDSFLPAHLCKRGHGLFAALRGRGAKAGPGEQGLLNAYCKVKEAAGGDSGRGASLSTHYRAYLLKSHELPFYG